MLHVRSSTIGLLATLLSTQAYAVSVNIDFDGFPRGVFAAGIEDGFNISASGGRPFVDGAPSFPDAGNPGQGVFNDQSGISTTTLSFSRVSGGVFDFVGLDLNDFFFSVGGTVTARGYVSNVLMDTDNIGFGHTWQSIAGSPTFMVGIDLLEIDLPANWSGGSVANVDNVRLDIPATLNVSMPEPASASLLLLASVGLMSRRYRRVIG